MFINHLLKPHSRVGIDLGVRWIKAVEVGSSGRVLRSARFARSGSQLDTAEIGRLCEILSRQGFALNTVSLLPSHEAVHRHLLQLPPKPDPTRDLAIVRAQFSALSISAEEPIEAAWWELPQSSRSQGNREAMAYAADPRIIKPWIRSFESHGVRVHGIDLHSVACVRELRVDQGLIVDLGWSRLGLTLVVDGRPVYERSDSDLGLSHVIEREVSRTGRRLEEIEALINREDSSRGLMTLGGTGSWIESVCNAVAATHEYSIRRYRLNDNMPIILIGGGSIQGVLSAVCQRTGLACEIGESSLSADQTAAYSTAKRWAA